MGVDELLHPRTPCPRRRRRAEHRRRRLDGPALPGLHRRVGGRPARSALAAVAAFKPHLIVLDVMLPDMEGFDVAQRLGAQRAQRADHLPHRARRDRGQGPRADARRRRLRHQALQPRGARRAHPLDPAPHRASPSPSPSRLVFEDLELDEDAHEVTRGGTPIELTATEYRLLRYLMLNPRRVLTRAQLLEHVWDYDFGGDARVLETYISYLRKKLDAARPAADPHRARRRLRAAHAADVMASLRARLLVGAARARRRRAAAARRRSPTPSSARSATTASTSRRARAVRRSTQRARARMGDGSGAGPRRRRARAARRPRAAAAGPGSASRRHLRPAARRHRQGARRRSSSATAQTPRGHARSFPPSCTPGHVFTVDANGGGGRATACSPQRHRRQPGITIVGRPAARGRPDARPAAAGRGARDRRRPARARHCRLGRRARRLLPLDRIGAHGRRDRRRRPLAPRRADATRAPRSAGSGIALNAMLDRLEQAFAEREASEDRLRRFLADASHELRTPLASIRGYAELFRMGAARDADGHERAMRRIEDEAARMGVLVEDLLTLARLDEVRDAPRDRRGPRRARARRRRRRARDRARTATIALDGARRPRAGRPAPAAPGARATWCATRSSTRPAGTPIEVAVERATGERRARGPRPRPGPADRRTRTRCSSASGARRAAASAARAGAGLGLAIVSRDRRRPRRQRGRRERARRRRALHGPAAGRGAGCDGGRARHL